MGGVRVYVKEAAVSYRETVVKEGEICKKKATTKSKKLHHRLLTLEMKAWPLRDRLTEEIEDGTISDPKKCAWILPNEFGWDADTARKIWCLDPSENAGPNVLVGRRSTVNEVRSYITDAFKEAALKGALVNEKIRGVCFELLKAKIHSDAVQRHEKEIKTAASAVVYASQMAASPGLYEPMCSVKVKSPERALANVNRLILESGGIEDDVDVEILYPETRWHTVKGTLPAVQVFAFCLRLNELTCGEATIERVIVDGWRLMMTVDKANKTIKVVIYVV